MAERLRGLLRHIQVVGLYGLIAIYVLGLLGIGRSLAGSLVQGAGPSPEVIVSFVGMLLLLGIVGDAFAILRSYIRDTPRIAPVLVLGIVGAVIGFLDIANRISAPQRRSIAFAAIGIKLGALVVAYKVLRSVEVSANGRGLPAD